MSTTVTLSYHQQILKSKDEQHQKEIRILENKIQRFKQAADDRRKELFEELNRGERLSKSLGFTSVHDAQCAIDTVDSELSFVECYNQLSVLENKVDAAQKEQEILRLQSSQLEEENSTLLSQLKELRLLKDKLSTELEDLRKRYDDLESVRKRSLECYKADYAKWSTFAAWLVKPDHAWNEEGLTPAEKKKRGIVQKREMFSKVGPNLSNLPFDETLGPPPPLGGTKVIEEEDNTPKRKRSNSDTAGTSEIQKSVLRPIDNIPSTSSVIPKLPARHQDLICPPLTTTQVKEEPMSSPVSHKRSRADPDRAPCSSDTEDDSQAVFVTRPGFPNMTYKVPAPLPSTNVLPAKKSVEYSSETEDESQEFPMSSPSLPPRPTRQPPPPVRREPSTIASPMRQTQPHTERPSKFRRLSMEGSPRRIGKLPVSTPRNASGPARIILLRSEGAPVSALKGKEREPSSTPLARSGQTRMDDYSVFKGRGRYGKTVNGDAADQTTINALFEIDPAANAGKDFQYEEVVRKKDQRKKLHAGDCECCRDYYDTIGPLPERPKQPLWRSPSKTPQRSQLHTNHHLNDENDESQLDAPSSSSRWAMDTISHKKQISRHRYAWERAKTPPGFWDIGFPSTQEVRDINERADNIDKKKRDAIDREAASGTGRYRRK